MRPELPTLIKARALISDPLDWGKGRRSALHDEGLRDIDTCCAAEAIEAAEPNIDRRKRAYRALARAVHIGEGSIVHWNDAPERTHAEVLAAFDKAIASAS